MVSPRHVGLLSCLVYALGCGGSDDDVDPVVPDANTGSMADAPVEAVDASVADAGIVGCPLSAGCPEWFEEYTRQVVATLSGAWPIADGVVLTQRFEERERAAVRGYLADELSRLGLEPVLHPYATGANVFAELPATDDGGQLIVLGAHFDGVAGAPAAADDASGVAVVLAAARYLVQLEQRSAGVIFVLFDEEESGLLGSIAFADKLRFEHPPVLAMHNFDMVSWDGDDDRGVELWSPAPELERLYRTAASDVGIPIASYAFERSDHAAFIAQGMPAVGVGEEYNQGDTTPFYHQATDTYDQIDFGFLVSTLQLGLLVIERQLTVD